MARATLLPFARLRVTGDVPPGPLILAANHVSPVDPVVLMAACRTRRVAPLFMADAAVFRMRGLGWIMRGHIPVARGTAAVTASLEHAAAALAGGATVLVYPEGRIGLDPGLWPERGKTGTARLALASGAVVVPVAQWGTHELVPYTAPRGALRGLARSLRRRPVVRVHFGAPLTLTGSPRAATAHLMATLTATLAGLRPDGPRSR